jgi:polysaccharide export outer membrane protein
MANLKEVDRIQLAIAVRIFRALVLVLIACTPCQASQEVSNSSSEARASDEYRLAPGDTLSILVFDQAQLSGNFVISGDGQVVLPLAGSVAVADLTLGDAQRRIQDRFADGILVHPTVSIRVGKYRPIFVTGYVRKPGNYPFIIGASIKAAVAAAGGPGEPSELPDGVARSDALTAEERVRQLETDRLALLVRKARLEAQRDEAAEFVIPQFVGLNADDVAFRTAYSAENDAFTRLVSAYQNELRVLQQQKPRIDTEIKAVKGDMAKQKDQFNNLSSQIDEYQDIFNRGLLRKPEITQLQIQRSLVQAELSRLQAEISRLEQSGADIDAKTETVKSNYTRQILGELEATSERLGNINATLGTARQLREFRVQKLSLNGEEPNYLFEITRTDSNGLSTFNANTDTQLKPGDVIDVKLNAHQTESSLPIEAELSRSLLPKADVLNSTNSVKSEETPFSERSKRQSR